jgi:hypothetical protein
VTAPVYSKQFMLAHASSAHGAIAPPPGTIWIVVQVLVYSGNTATTDLSWSLVVSPELATVVFLPFPDLKIGTLFFNGRIVIRDDQQISAMSSSSVGSSNVDYYVGGYELFA